MRSFPTAEEITRDWGERCPEYHRECSLCQMWGMHDEMARLTTERDEWIAAAVKQQKAAKWARAEERERAAQYHDNLADQHDVASDGGNIRHHVYEARQHRRHAAAIRASKE